MIRSIQFIAMTLAFACTMSAHAESEIHSTVSASQLYVKINDQSASASCSPQVGSTLKKYVGDISSCVTVIPVEVWVNAKDPATEQPTYVANYNVSREVVYGAEKDGGTDRVKEEAVQSLEKQLKRIGSGCYGNNVTVVVKSDVLSFDLPNSKTALLKCQAAKYYEKFKNSKYGQKASELYKRSIEKGEEAKKKYEDLKAKAMAESAKKARELADILEKNK